MTTMKMSAHAGRKKKRDGMIKSRRTRVGDLVIALICFILMLVCLLPMIHVLAASLSTPDALINNEVFLWRKG